jgi:hypothetical protein
VTTITVDLRDLERAYRNHAKQIPFAASKALTDTAWDIRRDLITRASGDMTFRKPVQQALGIGVNKATKASLTAEVGSKRGFLVHQVQDGTAEPLTGVTWKGRQYLLIPNEGSRKLSKAAKTRIRKSGGATFVIQSRSGPILVRRLGPDTKGSALSNIAIIGKLVPRAKYANDYGWQEQSEETFERKFGPNFAKAMDKAIATAR